MGKQTPRIQMSVFFVVMSVFYVVMATVWKVAKL